MIKWIVTFSALLAGFAATAFSAVAQPSEQHAATPNIRLATLLRRSALLDLGMQESPTVEDYACAQSVLSIALELNPTNADLARLLAEASWSCGDESMMLDATRAIVRSDPKDTVALLRLISAKINQHQTAEARLESYARYLGPSAVSIDPAVRSRLALDAALLEREMGNSEGFVQRLSLAEKLDPSNKDAVSLGAQIYGQQLTDPVARMNLQVKVLMADPLDPNVHTMIAEELAAQGAVQQAARFMNNAARIYTVGGGNIPPMLQEQRISLAWQVSGPESIVKQLNASIADTRAQAASTIEARLAVDEPIDDIPAPETIRMGLTVDRIRLLAAFAVGDEETINASLKDINASTAEIQRESSEAVQKRSANQNALFQEYLRAMLTLEAMRAVVGRESELMRADAAEHSSSLPQFTEIFQRIEPWILYAEGNYQEAIDGISPDTDSVNSMMILGLAYAKLDDIDSATKWFGRVARARPLTAFGAFARSRMKEMGREESIVSPAGRRMISIERTVPPWIDEMVRNPTSYVYLSVEPTKRAFDAMEDARVRITIRNIAPIPMSIGAARPIESRFLLVPSVDGGAQSLEGKPHPRVLELNRRLRLMPGEELVVFVNADDAYTDWLIDLQPFATLRGRWRVLQGFTAGRFGGLTNSPFGLVTETDIIQRLPLAQTQLTGEQLLDLLNSDDGLVRRKGVQAIASLLVTDHPEYRRSLAESESFVQGLMELYKRASSDERAEMLLVLPHARQFELMSPFDDFVREQLVIDGLVDQAYIDPDLFAAVLLTRVIDPENPVFEAARSHDDQRVRALGELLARRLNSGKQSLATARGMIHELSGKSAYSQDRP